MPRLGAPVRLVLLVSGCTIFGAAPAAWANNIEDVSHSIKSGQYAKALDQVDRYLADKPKDAQGRFLKGIILTGMNKQGEAIAVFRKLTEDYPELPEPYNNLAVIYAQQKQYDKAKEALEMAIRTHPAYATAHENLGDIYSRLASQAYGKALQIDSTNESAQTKLAMISDLVGTGKVGVGGTAPTPIVAASKTPTVQPAAPAPTPPTPIVVATVKPAEPAKPVDASIEIAAAIDGWLSAWSKKDVKGYLAVYAKDFDPPKDQSRKEWENERTQRVGKPGKIEVSRDKLAIKAEGDDKVVVRFRQHYKSASLSTSSGKTLVLVKRDGKWLIQQERVGG